MATSKTSILLPTGDSKLVRWTPHKKRAVLEAIESGRLTKEDVCERWLISGEELAQWRAHYQRHGILGLYTTVRTVLGAAALTLLLGAGFAGPVAADPIRIPFTTDDTGEIYIPIRVNGTAIACGFDTGASMSQIPGYLVSVNAPVVDQGLVTLADGSQRRVYVYRVEFEMADRIVTAEVTIGDQCLIGERTMRSFSTVAVNYDRGAVEFFLREENR